MGKMSTGKELVFNFTFKRSGQEPGVDYSIGFMPGIGTLKNPLYSHGSFEQGHLLQQDVMLIDSSFGEAGDAVNAFYQTRFEANLHSRKTDKADVDNAWQAVEVAVKQHWSEQDG